MSKWEYRTDAVEMLSSWSGPKPDRSLFEKKLADAGNDGWELVSAIPNTALTKTPIILIFKREKR